MSTIQRTICVDLDGTITRLVQWEGETKFGPIIPGSKQALQSLRSKGWRIIVYTTRANRSIIGKFLREHDIPFDHINHNPSQPKNARGGKIYANVYLDDRAIRFRGDWAQALLDIDRFQPWEQENTSASDPHYNDQAAENFLLTDFAETYSQVRHYDSSLLEITKYALLQLFAVVAATWGIYAFAASNEAPLSLKTSWPWVAIALLLLSYLFGLTSIFMLTRLRLYFVLAARYLNEHRNHFLKHTPFGFQNLTGFYTRFDQPLAFDPLSTHMISIYFIGTACSLLLAGAFQIALSSQLLSAFSIVSPEFTVGLSFSISFFALTIIPLRYLKSKDQKTANQAVFGST